MYTCDTWNMTKTKEIDRHGNVSYRIEMDGQHIGQIRKMCGGRWQVEATTRDGYIVKPSVKAGMQWLQWYLGQN